MIGALLAAVPTPAAWTYADLATIIGGLGLAIMGAVKWADDRSRKAIAERDVVYAADLADLRSQVEALRARVAELEDRQAYAQEPLLEAYEEAVRIDNPFIVGKLKQVKAYLFGPRKPREVA